MYAYESGELAGETVEGGSRVEAFERAFAAAQHVNYCLATTGGSGALEIACRAIGLQPGDEVITTPYTFVASSSCILNALAIPVFVDIEPETYNINPSLVEEKITDRTRAILPVHFGGNIADMSALTNIAQRHGLKIIEDSAQAQGASLKGNRWAGGLGDIGIFSLQQSKLLTCGEGGIVSTNDKELAELAWSLRHYGREKEGLWYEHFRLGWHYRMTELQGALLLTQLRKLPEQNRRRAKNAAALFHRLGAVPGVQHCQQNPEADQQVFYLVILRYDHRAWDGLSRETLLEALRAEGIPCLEGYTFPLYENPIFASIDFNDPSSPYRVGRDAVGDFQDYRGMCPVSERACREESIWLTHDLLLGSEEDTLDIARAFEKLYDHREELRDLESSSGADQARG
jgi:dTDP-4-amino-4,6-dideoxygalactose transaminase